MKDGRREDPVTRALHTRVDTSRVSPVTTPIYQNSAFGADSPYFYTRKNNPNSEELEQVVAALEEAPHAISCCTGMSAISLVVSLLRPRQRLVINKDIYGCSFRYFQRVKEQRELSLSVLDLSQPEGIAAIPADSAMIFFETPTNPFLKTVAIDAVVARAKALPGRPLVVVDNTWATPLFQKPLALGADLSVYSATKFFSGHSDVMGGLVVTGSSDLEERLRDERFYSGCILDPHSAWLLRRSMQTFALRMREHARMTREMAAFLGTQAPVSRVYRPELDPAQLTDYGGILFFDLRPELVARYPLFRDALQLFDSGTGMAAVTSMVAQPYTGSHASMSDAEKEEMGLRKSLVRLCFGLEAPEDLKADLAQAFSLIDSGEGASRG